ncbi:MAG: heme o synthase [Planctomycetota bacterium]
MIRLSTRSRVHDLAELSKLRIQVFALGAAMVAFLLAPGSSLDLSILLPLLTGLFLVCSGAAILNQVAEVRTDALMKRTCNRPLPAQRMGRGTALGIGLASSATGIAALAFWVNPLTAALALLMVVLYDLVYTPLKRLTSFNTVLGAVPGAMPVLLGWAAATGSLAATSWILFGIVFLWQFPHFLAIAWLHREDYPRAGLKMLPVVDLGMTGRQAAVYALALVPVSLLPATAGGAGPLYFFGALALSVGFLAFALRFCLTGDHPGAQSLLRASLAYLPLILVLLLVDTARAAGS